MHEGPLEKKKQSREVVLLLGVPIIYVAIAVAAYMVDKTVLLLLLAVPWSVPLMMLSGLVLHSTVYGKALISIGCLIGVFLNALIYVYISVRRKAIRRIE